MSRIARLWDATAELGEAKAPRSETKASLWEGRKPRQPGPERSTAHGAYDEHERVERARCLRAVVVRHNHNAVPTQRGIHAAERKALGPGFRRDDGHVKGAGADVGARARAQARRIAARLAAWRSRIDLLLALRRYLVAAGPILAAYGLGSSGYVHAKASLAQVLVRAAWERSVARGAPVRPWPWADTWPVAMLEVPRLGERHYVLAGASGRTLAFGPALSTGARKPGERGRVVVSGHRDTHFAFLRVLERGDRVWLSDGDGRHAYEVVGARIADARTQQLSIAADDARLALVTCWPFDAIVPGGPLRYVVEARLVASAAPAS